MICIDGTCMFAHSYDSITLLPYVSLNNHIGYEPDKWAHISTVWVWERKYLEGDFHLFLASLFILFLWYM